MVRHYDIYRYGKHVGRAEGSAKGPALDAYARAEGYEDAFDMLTERDDTIDDYAIRPVTNRLIQE